MRSLLIVCFAMLCLIIPVAATSYTDAVQPLPVRQEKARLLLHLVSHVSSDFSQYVSLLTETDMQQFEQFVDRMAADGATSSPTIGPSAERFLVSVLTRYRMIDDLDFSDDAVRHFYRINAGRYDCTPRAEISQFFIPAVWLTERNTTETLSVISRRLESELFERVAFEVTSQFTTPTLPSRTDVLASAVDEQEFLQYRQIADRQNACTSSSVLMLTDPSGVRFVKVYRVIDQPDQCFEYHRDRVTNDYGTQWYRKTVHDTVTTLTAELKPDLNEINNVPSASDVAFTVKGHQVTFGDCRNYLPFLLGNSQQVKFWQSVQRQALEIELFYQSPAGATIRESEDYRKLARFLSAIESAEKRIELDEKEKVTTAALQQYYRKTIDRYTEIRSVTGKLYQCSSTENAERLRCAACLATLTDGGDCGEDVSVKDLRSAPWQQFGREFQYAVQSVSDGEWSAVFTQEGVPVRVHVGSVERISKPFEAVSGEMTYNYRMQLREAFWRRLITENNAAPTSQNGK